MGKMYVILSLYFFYLLFMSFIILNSFGGKEESRSDPSLR